MSLIVVDLFAGAGGFARGFRDEGFRIALAIENFAPVAESYSINFPESKLIIRDIKLVHSSEILDAIGDRPDVIIGSPPCEPFTGANPRRKRDPLDRLYKDPIGNLVLHFVRIVGDLQPDVFVMENVPALAEGDLKRALQREFEKVGYRRIYFNLLRAERFGTPSRRLRLFVSNVEIAPEESDREITVWEAIGDLPDPRENTGIPNHEFVPLSPRKLRKISRLRWGEALIKYRGAKDQTLTNWIRLHPYRIAPTVMGGSRFIHPFEDRLLTVREQARLMGFPDDFVFVGGRELQYNQVGEAVPPPLARAIARFIKDYL